MKIENEPPPPFGPCGELTARMADLLAETTTAGDGQDWTEDDEE